MDQLTAPTLYLSSAYAESMSEFGEPVAFPRSGGFLLTHSIPDTGACDAMACYPLLCCGDCQSLAKDLLDCTDVMSIVAVSDRFARQNWRSL